jgi:hypothetical protein
MNLAKSISRSLVESVFRPDEEAVSFGPIADIGGIGSRTIMFVQANLDHE